MIAFVTANAFFKVALEGGLSVQQLLMIKSAICLLMGAPILWKKQDNPFSQKGKNTIRILTVRGLIAICSIFAYNYSFFYMPLTYVNVVFMSYPFIAGLFGYLINREPVILAEKLGMVVCFTGIAIFALSN